MFVNIFHSVPPRDVHRRIWIANISRFLEELDNRNQLTMRSHVVANFVSNITRFTTPRMLRFRPNQSKRIYLFRFLVGYNSMYANTRNRTQGRNYCLGQPLRIYHFQSVQRDSDSNSGHSKESEWTVVRRTNT